MLQPISVRAEIITDRVYAIKDLTNHLRGDDAWQKKTVTRVIFFTFKEDFVVSLVKSGFPNEKKPRLLGETLIVPEWNYGGSSINFK